jgi:hypothetical protein
MSGESNMVSGGRCSAPEVHLLGEIVIAFGNLELVLETSIWHLLKVEDDAEGFLMVQALTADMSFAGKVHALGSMFRQRQLAEAEPELKELIKDLFAAEAERNQLFHSAWSYSDVFEGDLMRMKASVRARRGTLKRSFHRMTAKHIEMTLSRIAEVGQFLLRFTVKYIQAPGPEIE